LIIDTHGEAVDERVWQLLDLAYQHFGVFPTVLERDFNLPPLMELVDEARRIQRLQRKHGAAPAGREVRHG
jgi:hypothetical protein